MYGGDSFYFEAPLSVTGTFKSGKLYGSVGETWRTLVVSTGNGEQNIGVFESESASPVSFTVDWLEMTRISLIKKDAGTGNPLSGAVYGIYTDKACSNLLMKMSATNISGKTVSDYFDASLIWMPSMMCWVRKSQTRDFRLRYSQRNWINISLLIIRKNRELN